MVQTLFAAKLNTCASGFCQNALKKISLHYPLIDVFILFDLLIVVFIPKQYRRTGIFSDVILLSEVILL